MKGNYCIKQHTFFYTSYPIVEDNLTKEKADELCEKYNKEEMLYGDALYTHYEVHKKRN